MPIRLFESASLTDGSSLQSMFAQAQLQQQLLAVHPQQLLSALIRRLNESYNNWSLPIEAGFLLTETLRVLRLLQTSL